MKPSSVKPPAGKQVKSTGLKESARSGGSQLNVSIAQSAGDTDQSTGSSQSFTIGDRVLVSGSKPGIVAYIGSTQFAVGDWVGVELDTPSGKNDGSVNGVRYFTCKPLHGVFAKAAKLTKLSDAMTAMPQMTDSGVGSVEDESVFKAPSLPHSADVVAGSLSSAPDVSMSEAAAAAEISSPPPTTGGKNEESPSKLDVSQSKRLCKQLNKNSDQEAQPKRTGTAVKGPGLIPRSTFGSTVSLNKAPLGSSSADLNATISDSSVKHSFKVGDRVTVGSNKIGVLRYIGTTDFAKGEWAGVELDEPLGKNDGSVNGKRYFQCVPLYGLFAPIAKVGHLMVSPASSRRGSVSRIPVGPTLALARERSGSQDSLNSIGSMASSASRTRLRLGVTSLAGQTPKGRPGAGGDTNSSSSALQKALKEKEEHVEQLLLERDLERSEVARSAMKVEEVETEIATITTKYNKLLMECDEQRQNMQKMKIRIDSLEKENEVISSQLEEERKKVDDLQFAVEETSIDKGDLETRTERDARKLKEMEQQLLAETSNVRTLTQELNKLKAQHGEDVKTIALLEVKANQYNRQVEDLMMKLSDESDRSAFLESERVCHLEVQQEEMKEEIKEQTDKLTSAIEDVSKELSEALAKIKFLEAEKEVTYSQLQQYQQLESQKKEMEQTLITEKQKLFDAEQKLTEMKEQVNTACELERSKLSDLERLNRDLQVKLDMAANREQQLSDEISRQQSKVTDLEKANSSLSADVEILRAEQTKLVEAKRLLSETVELSDAANADLKSDLYKQLEMELSKTAELAAARRELEAEIEKITSVKNECLNLTAAKDLKICELEQEIEKIKQELDASISSLKNEHQSSNEKKDLKISELEHQALLMKQELDQINALNLKEVNIGLTAQLEQLQAIELENVKALETERSKLVELEALKSAEIKSREDSLQELQHNLDEAVNKLKQSESRLCDVEKLYSNSQAELDAATNAKQDLLKRFESEQLKITNFEKAVEKLAEVENSFALMTELSDQQKIEITKLESVVRDLNDKLQHSETVSEELSRLKTVESALRQELEAERSKVAEMSETKQDMQVELEQLRITEKELQRLTDQHRNSLIELEQLKNSSTEKVGQLSADLSSYSKQIEDKDECIMASKNQIQELTSKLADAEKCYSEQAELLALQKAQFSELEHRNLELTSKFEALQKSSSDQVATIDLKQKKITEVEELCQRLSDQLKSIQQTADERCIEIDQLLKVNVEFDNSIKQLTHEHGELKSALEAKVKEIESLQKDHVAFQEVSSRREAEVKKILESESENKSKLERYIEDLKTELEAVKAERSHQFEAMQVEQQKLLEIAEKERLLSEENEKIKIELKDAEELKLKILELERSHSEKSQAAEKTCCDLTQAVDKYRQQCIDLEAKLDQRSSDLAASKASEMELLKMRQEDRMKFEELERTNKKFATKFEAVKGTETDQLKLIEIEQAKVAELERQCRQLCAEVDLSKKSVDESKSNVAALQDGNAILAAEVEKLKADLRTLENEKQLILADHSRAVEELNSKLEEITSSKIELHNSLESEKRLTGHLKTDVETLKVQLCELETVRDLEKNKVLDGEEKYRQLELEIQQLREESIKEMENMQAKVEEFEQRNKLLLESNSLLSSEQIRAADEHKLKLSELNELVDALNVKLDLFASSDSELKSTIDLTSAKNNDLIKANQELLAEIELVKSELAEQTKSLDAERERNASLEKQQAGLLAELDILKTSMEQKSGDNLSTIVALEKCNAELTAQVNLLKADEQALVVESERKYGELNQVLLQEQSKVNELAQIVEQDKAKIKDLTLTLGQSQAKIGELTQITEQDKTKIDQLTEAVELGQAKISELNQMIGGDQAKITELSEEVRQNVVKMGELNGLLEEGKCKIGDLTEMVERGQVKIADLTQVVEQQQSEIKELNEINVALRSKIDSAMSTESEKSELLTSEQLRRTELEKSNGDLQLKIRQIESECVEHKKSADNGQQKVIVLEQEILALREANTARLNENSAVREQLEMDVKQLKQLNLELNDRLQQVCEENRQNIVTSEDYKEQMSRLKVLVEQLEAELVQSKTSATETLSQTSAELVAALEAEKLKLRKLEQSVDVLTSEKDRLNCVEIELRDELQAKGVKLEQFDKMAVELEQSQVLIQQLRTEKEVEQQRFSELQMAFKKLESEHGLASADVQNKIILLGAEKAELQTEADDLRSRLQQADYNLLEQKRSMQSVVDSNAVELRQKDSRLEQMKTEMMQLTKDLAAKSDLLASIQRDNSALKSKVSLLEKHGQGTNGAGDSETASETRAEVEFLNSVIVELQRKNESLQKQLEASLTMSAPTSTHKGSESPIVSRAVAPRLFCDICDVFDQHDTDDCPRQAMTSDSPPPQCHGDFNQIRPYCDNCEVFGHWTSDCDDDQTY